MNTINNSTYKHSDRTYTETLGESFQDHPTVETTTEVEKNTIVIRDGSLASETLSSLTVSLTDCPLSVLRGGSVYTVFDKKVTIRALNGGGSV